MDINLSTMVIGVYQSQQGKVFFHQMASSCGFFKVNAARNAESHVYNRRYERLCVRQRARSLFIP